MRALHSGRRRRSLHVTIVSDNPETLDGLESYLRRAGVMTNGTRHLEKLTEVIPPVSAVVILFPDDFYFDLVLSALETLRLQRPTILPVLITSEPKRFEALPAVDSGFAPLVVPKPVWGCTILDAVRARLEAEPHAAQELG
ncbi:MAG TPA: hypothetical protein VI072_17930 [Polyangiaceae bacterium]